MHCSTEGPRSRTLSSSLLPYLPPTFLRSTRRRTGHPAEIQSFHPPPCELPSAPCHRACECLLMEKFTLQPRPLRVVDSIWSLFSAQRLRSRVHSSYVSLGWGARCYRTEILCYTEDDRKAGRKTMTGTDGEGPEPGDPRNFPVSFFMIEVIVKRHWGTG